MKHIKVTGCHDPFCPVYKFKGAEGMICHRITYKAEIGKSPFNEIEEYIKSKTIHPDCPLDDLEDNRMALFAALRWIANEYRNHINNNGAYEIMMNDDTIGELYKEDITLIRSILK